MMHVEALVVIEAMGQQMSMLAADLLELLCSTVYVGAAQHHAP